MNLFMGNILDQLANRKLIFQKLDLGVEWRMALVDHQIFGKNFFPKATINILEYDKNCAEKFSDKGRNLYTGDQSDFKVLKEVANGGPYDVIVDDGGHHRNQQINSLIGLWPYVKPKGFYVIEDINTSFVDDYNNNPNESAVDVIFQLISLLNESNKALTASP